MSIDLWLNQIYFTGEKSFNERAKSWRSSHEGYIPKWRNSARIVFTLRMTRIVIPHGHRSVGIKIDVIA